MKRDEKTKQALYAYVPKTPTDDEMRHDARLSKIIHLVPKQPVWKQTNCLSFEAWYDVYDTDIIRIFHDFENCLEYMTTINGYNISYDQHSLYWNFAFFMYKNAENVKKNYPHFMNDAYDRNSEWMQNQWDYWESEALRLFQEINNKTYKSHNR